jgi:hypothetical protein
MRFTDRLLLLVAIVSGLLMTHGAVLAEPDAPSTCVDTCQETSQYYDCTKDHAYEYELTDCFHCTAVGAGNCLSRPNLAGGKCKQTDTPRKWRYVGEYTKSCECKTTVTRVEIKGTTAVTRWDSFPNDLYYVCKQ